MVDDVRMVHHAKVGPALQLLQRLIEPLFALRRRQVRARWRVACRAWQGCSEPATGMSCCARPEQAQHCTLVSAIACHAHHPAPCMDMGARGRLLVGEREQPAVLLCSASSSSHGQLRSLQMLTWTLGFALAAMMCVPARSARLPRDLCRQQRGRPAVGQGGGGRQPSLGSSGACKPTQTCACPSHPPRAPGARAAAGSKAGGGRLACRGWGSAVLQGEL